MDRPVVIVSVAAVAVAVGGWWWTERRVPVDLPAVPRVVESPNGGRTEPPSITAHVSGWVADPGLVVLEEGARWADAVAAAGGALPGAELGAINLATPVVDGTQIAVPGPEASHLAGTDGAGSGLVSLNTASAEELQALPGVGPVMAERIVQFRRAHGGFETPEDLLDVPGIGEGRLAQLRDLISVP